MSLWAVLLTGLLAGGASCAAVQGGLLAGIVARRHGVNEPVAVSPKGKKGKNKNAGQAVLPPQSLPSAIDDVVPVGMFLVGKLISHTILGAALGLLGDAAQLGITTRAVMQVLAGVVMLLLALNLLGVRALKNVVPSVPASWGRLVRRNTKLGSGFAPGLLGVATVLIPCGITLSMMFLAVASGSMLAGAAIMGTFVVGTIPLFAVIGYVARRSTSYLQGRLMKLAGAAVLVAGLVSLNTGLTLGGSPVTLTSMWSPSSSSQSTGSDEVALTPAISAEGTQRLALQATGSGYSPSVLTAKAGVPTELLVTATKSAGCTRTIVLRSFGIQKNLSTKETTIPLGTLKPGTYKFVCGMGMYSGSIKVEV